jgi:4,5-DOPA dioxygenase extradiol
MAKTRMPVIFIGHGSPENAIEDNEFTRTWKRIARAIPRPKAILCISAHWVTEGSFVTAMAEPRTIHDFYGFPEELFKMEYNAHGSLDLAHEIMRSVKSTTVMPDSVWGLDHGAWSVLVKMYPEADIPVVQLSLDEDLEPAGHVAIGRELAKLREEGILIIGSGNIVHNLGMMDPEGASFVWALKFDSFVKESLEQGSAKPLIGFRKQKSSMLAHPTDEHYLPLLYVLGASLGEKPRFYNEKMFWGSLSMRCVFYGLEEKE